MFSMPGPRNRFKPEATPGKAVVEVLVRRISVRCADCHGYDVREARLVGEWGILRELGWTKTERGWVCRACWGRPLPLGLKGVRRDKTVGRLLELWYLTGAWKPAYFQRTLKVRSKAIYDSRRQLLKRGFVDPTDLKRLTVLVDRSVPVTQTTGDVKQ